MIPSDPPARVVRRLRGRWRQTIHEPPQGRSAVVVIDRVVANADEASLAHRRETCLAADDVRQLLASLADSFQIVSLESALQPHHDPLPRIALTFDGGWSGVATHVAPILEHLALPASVFLPDPSLRTPWLPDLAALGELLYADEVSESLLTGLVALGLPWPPDVSRISANRRSETINDYLAAFDPAGDARLGALMDALWPETTLAELALDAFTVRRLEQQGLIRFGTLSDCAALASSGEARHHRQRNRRRLARLCQAPLEIGAWTDDGPSAEFDSFLGESRWLTRRPGWIPLSPRTQQLPRFVITRSLARSPGSLFDLLLGQLER